MPRRLQAPSPGDARLYLNYGVIRKHTASTVPETTSVCNSRILKDSVALSAVVGQSHVIEYAKSFGHRPMRMATSSQIRTSNLSAGPATTARGEKVALGKTGPLWMQTLRIVCQ